MDAAGRSSGISHSDAGAVVQRLEVLEGPSGRRCWPDAVKGQIVAESFASAASVSATARRHRLAPSQLFAWRREAKAGKLVVPADEAAPFAPLLLDATMPTVPPAGRCEARIEIAVGAVTVRLPLDTPAQRIAEIAAALAAAL